MKILKPIEFLYNLRIEIIQLIAKGSNDVSNMKLQKLKNDFDGLAKKDSIRDFEIHTRYKKTLRKTKLITFFIFFGFATSISLTLAGTNKIDFFDIYTLNTPNLVYCSIIFFLQSIVYIVTSRESIIKEKYYNHYLGFKIAQYIIVASSIYYNYRFFLMMFKNMSVIEKIITLLICAGLDLVTINLIALKNDMKNNITSTKKVKDNLKVKDILKNKNVLKKILIDEKVKDKIEVKDILKVKDKIEPVKKNPKENLNDISLIEKNIKTENPKDNIKTPKVIDMKYIKIGEYIIDKYIDEELIRWKEIKDKFDIKSEYVFKKLRAYLKDKDIIKTDGKKSYKKKCPKDILKMS